MTALDWLAIAGGLAAIIWVLWYCFLAERGAAGSPAGSPAGPPAAG